MKKNYKHYEINNIKTLGQLQDQKIKGNGGYQPPQKLIKMTEEQHKRANYLNNQMSEIKNALQIVDFGDTVSVAFNDTRNETSYNVELDNVATEAFTTELREFIKKHLQTRIAELTKEYAEL